MSTKKNQKIIIGKAPSAMSGNHWYEREGNILQYAKIMALPKPKAISYFKVKYASRGGSSIEEKFVKTLSDGFMIFVDVCNIRMGIMQGVPSSRGLEGCTKKDFDAAFTKILNLLKR